MGKYRTIVVDPPWEYRQKFAKSLPGGAMFKNGGGASKRYAAGIRGAAAQYDCMDVDRIKLLPVGGWADGNAHMYLWTTNAFLREAFDIMEAWGFAYKTTLTWAKNSIGMGFYFRGQTEHVLFGVKGSLKSLRKDVGTVFRGEGGAGPLRRHSEKPAAFYDIVESMSPGPYLDVFARKLRFNWDAWGLEVGAPPGLPHPTNGKVYQGPQPCPPCRHDPCACEDSLEAQATFSAGNKAKEG